MKKKIMEKGAINMKLDASKFQKKALAEIENAVKAVAYKVIEDVEYGSNAIGVPLDEGTLLGSSHVAINRSGGVEEDWYSAGGTKKADVTQPDLTGLRLQSARISYNTSYAEDIHEGYDQMIPGEGSQQKFGIPPEKQSRYGYKFLEKTLLMNQRAYYDLFKEIIEDGLA